MLLIQDCFHKYNNNNSSNNNHSNIQKVAYLYARPQSSRLKTSWHSKHKQVMVWTTQFSNSLTKPTNLCKLALSTSCNSNNRWRWHKPRHKLKPRFKHKHSYKPKLKSKHRLLTNSNCTQTCSNSNSSSNLLIKEVRHNNKSNLTNSPKWTKCHSWMVSKSMTN